MSGHSKWATTHRQKEIKDAVRGKLFSKLARAISIATKVGGSDDPDINLSLRVIIDKARANNMPKENIERAIQKAKGEDNLEQITYEGFGPKGVSVVVEVATDNRNRTSQEFKSVFDKAGGKISGPGSVLFNFEPKGMIVVAPKNANKDEDMLFLIDQGASDVEEIEGEGYEVYTEAHELFNMKNKIEQAGFKVSSFELLQKPKSYQDVEGEEDILKVSKFLETIEDLDDVQKVFTNANFVSQ